MKKQILLVWLLISTVSPLGCFAQEPFVPTQSLSVAGLKAKVTIRRDERGIPYIEAANEEAVARGVELHLRVELRIATDPVDVEVEDVRREVAGVGEVGARDERKAPAQFCRILDARRELVGRRLRQLIATDVDRNTATVDGDPAERCRRRRASLCTSTEQMLNAPVDATPESEGNAVGARSPKEPLTAVTKPLAAAALRTFEETAQFDPLVMSPMMTASERPAPGSRGLAKNLSDETRV